jgi:hypothetical protein
MNRYEAHIATGRGTTRTEVVEARNHREAHEKAEALRDIAAEEFIRRVILIEVHFGPEIESRLKPTGYGIDPADGSSTIERAERARRDRTMTDIARAAGYVPAVLARAQELGLEPTTSGVSIREMADGSARWAVFFHGTTEEHEVTLRGLETDGRFEIEAVRGW